MNLGAWWEREGETGTPHDHPPALSSATAFLLPGPRGDQVMDRVCLRACAPRLPVPSPALLLLELRSLLAFLSHSLMPQSFLLALLLLVDTGTQVHVVISVSLPSIL